MRIAVNGALGRMGRMVLEAAGAHGHEVVAAMDAPAFDGRPLGSLAVIGDPSRIPAVDAGIDFSVPDAATVFVRALAGRGIPVVSGTTGLSEAHLAAMREASRTAPVLWTANTSLGVHCLMEVSALARSLLGPGYDVEIVEIHHRHKKDAPSGTALALAERLDPDLDRVTGRSGACGPRTDGELGVLAVRGGEVVGEHTVYFLGTHDRLEITHRATSRAAFAEGAIRLAERLVGRPAGWFGVGDLF
jgi:4-hydroxy-tetrahydrodipicolinate reductase